MSCSHTDFTPDSVTFESAQLFLKCLNLLYKQELAVNLAKSQTITAENRNAGDDHEEVRCDVSL